MQAASLAAMADLFAVVVPDAAAYPGLSMHGGQRVDMNSPVLDAHPCDEDADADSLDVLRVAHRC